MHFQRDLAKRSLTSQIENAERPFYCFENTSAGIRKLRRMDIGKRTKIQNKAMVPENCKVYSLRVRGLTFEPGCENF